jgi:hypothetical protein
MGAADRFAAPAPARSTALTLVESLSTFRKPVARP